MSRQTVSSGSPLEEPIGFSRAVRIAQFNSCGWHCPLRPGGNVQGCDAFSVYEQTRLCLAIVADAIRDAGGSLENVIRTRVMLTDISDVAGGGASAW